VQKRTRARIPIDLTASGRINSARCVRRGKIDGDAGRLDDRRQRGDNLMKYREPPGAPPPADDAESRINLKTIAMSARG